MILSLLCIILLVTCIVVFFLDKLDIISVKYRIDAIRITALMRIFVRAHISASCYVPGKSCVFIVICSNPELNRLLKRESIVRIDLQDIR